MTAVYPIPSSLVLSPFYKEGDTLNIISNAEVGDAPPFYFEWLNLYKPDFYPAWPWETKEGADELWSKWQTELTVPEHLFRERKPKKAEPFMVKLTADFICYLFWSEGKPVSFKDKGLGELENCAIVPVNGIERLKFICSAPSHYHAFVQLTALYEEARKKRALYNLKRNG